MYKQIIIVRKDLSMSAGKLAAQVSHASIAFLTWMIRNNSIKSDIIDLNDINSYDYECKLSFDKDLYEQWIVGEFTKCVLQAKNKSNLLKAKTLAEELGMKEGKDFFLIRDNCRTELIPEEDGRTLTCIGFKPMDNVLIDKIGKKFHLYID